MRRGGPDGQPMFSPMNDARKKSASASEALIRPGRYSKYVEEVFMLNDWQENRALRKPSLLAIGGITFPQLRDGARRKAL
jgi:hypothetical protein